MAYKKTKSEENKKDYTVEPFVKDEDKKQTEEQKVQQDNIENEKEESKVEAKQPEKNLADEYLNMARIIQADFDNYRKRTAESIKQAKLDGVTQAVEIFIPCLDVFKKAKEMISDDNSRKGIEMLEDQIRSSLKELGVEKIETIGKQFDPNLHHCLMVMEDKTKPDNIVLDEYQAGYRLGDKIIKYSQVIVNKLKEEK